MSGPLFQLPIGPSSSVAWLYSGRTAAVTVRLRILATTDVDVDAKLALVVGVKPVDEPRIARDFRWRAKPLFPDARPPCDRLVLERLAWLDVGELRVEAGDVLLFETSGAWPAATLLVGEIAPAKRTGTVKR